MALSQNDRSQPLLPVLWVAGLVLNGQDDDSFPLNQIEDCVGEASHDSPADTTVENRVECRVLYNPLKLLIDRSDEFMT